MDEKTFYESGISSSQKTLKQLRKELRNLSLIRLLSFALALTLIYFFWGNSNIVLVSILAFFILFLALLSRFTNVQRLLKLEKAYLNLCEEELKLLDGEYTHRSEGKEFINSDHPFTSDLNIFGKHSLFQYINRTQTNLSRKLLASWLQTTLSESPEIESERVKIKALSNNPEFMLRYLASASLAETNFDLGSKLSQWQASKLLHRPNWIYFGMRFIVPSITIVMTVLYALNYLGFNAYTLYLCGPALLVLSQIKRHTREFNQAIAVEPASQSTSEMLDLIQKSGITNEEWQNVFSKYELKGSQKTLTKFSKIVNAIESRNNVFVSIILNLFLMWDYHCAWRLKIWKKEYAQNLIQWMEIAYTVESYCSLGVFVFNHPKFVDPKLDEEHNFQIIDGIHFSLFSDGIRNSLDLSQKKFSIITGANMAGKSTYLRTVGTCLLLAMRGLPVPATAMSFSPAKLFTSMLSTDSLGEGQSYFFSELRRLRMLMDRLENGEFHFVILDEILKGTNSVDKAIGSKKFMEKILSLPAKGLIATHDLSLCELADFYPTEVSNNKFEISYSGDELVFNYRLEPGVCENMNASFLLEKMGLTSSR